MEIKATALLLLKLIGEWAFRYAFIAKDSFPDALV